MNDVLPQETQSSTYLLFMLGGQLFGVGVEDVQSVEMVDDLTSVPSSGIQVAGVSQLHGHIITAVDVRAALHLPVEEGEKGASFIVDQNGYLYSMMIDKVVGVFDLNLQEKDRVPETVDPHLRKISTGVLKHEGKLVLTTTADQLLEILS